MHLFVAAQRTYNVPFVDYTVRAEITFSIVFITEKRIERDRMGLALGKLIDIF